MRGAGPRRGAFRALRHAAFRWLYFSVALFQAGFWLSHISLQFLTGSLAETPEQASLYVGLYFAAAHLPGLLLVPWTGIAADRLDRRRMLMGAYAAQACVIGSLLALLLSGALSIEWLLLLVVGIGCSNAWASPALMASVADAVPRRDLRSGIALQAIAANITRVAGPLAAGAVFALSGPAAAFGTLLGVIAVVLAMLGRMRLAAHERDPGSTSVLGQLRSGISHARERHPAGPVLVSVVVMSVFGISHTALHLPFAEQLLGDGRYFPLLSASTGLGALAGSLFASLQRRTPSLRRAGLQLAAYGLALIAFSRAPGPAFAMGAQLAVGFFYFTTNRLSIA